MKQILNELLKLANEGKLEIEDVRINNEGFDIEIGHSPNAFSGDIKLTITSELDVLELGSRLSQAIKENNT